MRDILRVLDTAVRPIHDKHAFVKSQIIFWMLAATDGHAKNFSLFHERGGGYRMTPFYDVLSAWPIMGTGAKQLDPHKARLAMALRSKNAHWKLTEIKARHWETVIRAAGLGDANPILHEVVSRVPQVIEEVGRAIPVGFPESIRGRIFAGLEKSARQLA